MLVLTRKAGQTLKIGNNVVIEVLGPAGTRVKFGIHAPRETQIRRGELDELPPQEPLPEPVPRAA